MTTYLQQLVDDGRLSI